LLLFLLLLVVLLFPVVFIVLSGALLDMGESRRDAAEVMEEVVKLTLGINQMCVVRRKKEVFCSCYAVQHSLCAGDERSLARG
jgi:hypothetical protein